MKKHFNMVLSLIAIVFFNYCSNQKPSNELYKYGLSLAEKIDDADGNLGKL